uniref:Fibronectin type-III domain-containing protein n=1 Tax=Sus scrofa TaxID=9823 RepID=A0A8D1GKI0_PIG
MVRCLVESPLLSGHSPSRPLPPRNTRLHTWCWLASSARQSWRFDYRSPDEPAQMSAGFPEGNIVIGYSISQQRQNGPGQRVIREVNTTTRACALWGLAEDSDYTVQVRSIGLRGESPPGPRVHFRTLKGSDRLPSNSSSPGDITVEGLDGERPLQTGEVVIIVVVLLMWAAVIGLFCRQYDIIKDNDSNNNPKEKGKGPEQSPQGRPVGTRQKKSPSINTIDV